VEPRNELVYIVDGEASVGKALSTLLRANGKRDALNEFHLSLLADPGAPEHTATMPVKLRRVLA
jgi:hypothetical protein